jgi:hypothetical protein
MLQVMTSVVADYIEPGLRDPEYGRKLDFLKAQVREAPGHPLLLILGSSRTAYGVRADALLTAESKPPLAFNFGMLGAGPIYEMLHFRRLLNAGIHPRWLVLEIHPGFLKVVPSLIGAHRPPFDRCDARDLYAIHGYIDHPWDAWREWLHYRAAASYVLRAEVMRRLAPGWVPAPSMPDVTAVDKTTPSGWVPLHWPTPEESVRKHWAQLGCEMLGPSYQDFQVSDRTNRALREILETCRREQIVTSLLLMPEAEEMRDERAKSAQKEIVRYLTQLGDEYGASLIDATHWCRDEEFADGQHLLPEAATRFAARLGREALGEWVAATTPERRGASGPTFIAGKPRAAASR